MCPHCLKFTIPNKNICPSCGDDVTAKPIHDWVRVDVYPETKFPQSCHRCDLPTKRRGKLKTWHRESEIRDIEPYDRNGFVVVRIFSAFLSYVYLPFILLPLLFPLRFLIPWKTTKSVNLDTKTVIKIPTCRGCKKTIQLLGNDPSSRRHSIAVTKLFASRLADS